MTHPASAPADLPRCLGPLEFSAQAVFNIPQARRTAGSATWISYALALVMWGLLNKARPSAS
jgi:hypothetical protein